jgi:hypothetical protein
MRYHDLPHYLNFQFADACRAYTALCAAEVERKSYAGSMYWQQLNGAEYLTQASAGGRKKRWGPRSADTETVYAAFMSERQRAKDHYRHLAAAMKQQQRLNKVLRVGRLPVIWIRILNGLRSAGLADDVRVLGAAATYAYEYAAGVKIDGDRNNAGETSLLSDRRSSLQLAVPGAASALHVLAAIQHVAPAFQVYKGQRYVAIDHRGLEVEVLFDDANGNHAGAPALRQVVAGENGEMASMLTIEPRSFVLRQLYLAKQPGRDDFERYRDACLARLVMAMVQDRIEAPGPAGETMNAQGKSWSANSMNISA